jgi:hypothetical protein
MLRRVRDTRSQVRGRLDGVLGDLSDALVA